jgi:branched-chain amino acid transport system ATP-binding protein
VIASGIEVQHMTVSRGGRPVVRDVSLSIEPGKITALLGPNGAGKSSLVLAMAGALKPDSGQVRLDGRDMTGQRPELIRAAGVAAVPEGHKVLTQLSVEDNLLAAGSVLSKADLKTAVSDALAVFPELEPRAAQRAGTLSGGLQQMVALAQALVSKPRYLLADELSFGLAPLIVARLMDVIADIARSSVGVLLIEQFTTIALKIAQRVYVLDHGVIRFDGSPAEIKDNPGILHAAYLAGDFNTAGSPTSVSRLNKEGSTVA